MDEKEAERLDALMQRGMDEAVEATIKTVADRTLFDGSKSKRIRHIETEPVPVRREMRADVLKIMRRMRQRIADGRWSGLPS